VAETLLVKDKGLSSTRHPVYVINPKYNSAIHCRGEVYKVDFVAETDSDRYLIEIKARNELSSSAVTEKARAAIQWCELANENQLGKPWNYRLLPDDAVQTSSTLAFMLGMAIKDLSC
jgi:hypothetical protein